MIGRIGFKSSQLSLSKNGSGSKFGKRLLHSPSKTTNNKLKVGMGAVALGAGMLFANRVVNAEEATPETTTPATTTTSSLPITKTRRRRKQKGLPNPGHFSDINNSVMHILSVADRITHGATIKYNLSLPQGGMPGQPQQGNGELPPKQVTVSLDMGLMTPPFSTENCNVSIHTAFNNKKETTSTFEAYYDVFHKVSRGSISHNITHNIKTNASFAVVPHNPAFNHMQGAIEYKGADYCLKGEHQYNSGSVNASYLQAVAPGVVVGISGNLGGLNTSINVAGKYSNPPKAANNAVQDTYTVQLSSAKRSVNLGYFHQSNEQLQLASSLDFNTINHGSKATAGIHYFGTMYQYMFNMNTDKKVCFNCIYALDTVRFNIAGENTFGGKSAFGFGIEV